MKALKSTTLAAVMILLGACSGQTTRHEGTAATPEASAGPIPASSPLAQITLGMTFKAVRGLLGPPTDETSYPTGKAFIPFYFSDDARRAEWYYKGMGRVTFAAGNVFGGRSEGDVIRIEYDPSEIGVAR
jgi:hypothetical protein